jgi:hypothetical protein
MTDIVPLLPQLVHTPDIVKAIDTITGLISQVKSADDLFSKKDIIDRAPELDYRMHYEKKLPNDMLFIPIPFEILNISNAEIEVVKRYFEIRSGIVFSIKHIKVKHVYNHCIGFSMDVLYPSSEKAEKIEPIKAVAKIPVKKGK